MLHPRPESCANPTAVSAYVLERRMLRAYDALYAAHMAPYWRPTDRKRVQEALLGGNQTRRSQQRSAESRLREMMPELICKLLPEQQGPVAALLLCEEPDLYAVVAELVRLERNINHRDDDPRLQVSDDDWKVKATGLGKFRQPIAGAALAQRQRSQPVVPMGPPLILTPVVARPALRTKKRGRRPVPRRCGVLVGQYSLWPPVSGGAGVTVGL